MTALMTPVLPLSQRERMAQILSAAAYGLARTGACEDCLVIRRQCPGCKQANADVAKLNTAIGAVREARTEAAALGAFFDCLAVMTGAAVEVDTVTVCCAAGAR